MKRLADLAGALILSIPCIPLMGVIALAIRWSSPGTILFRQPRLGKNGKEFLILKFRTMRSGLSEPGPVLTRIGDPRLTWVGRQLRRWKLDELPQLFNVLKGDMSFVGPRPQPTKLWSHYKELPAVLTVRPGITGIATLAYRHEEEILQSLAAHEIEDVYIRTVMPLKLQLDQDYLKRATAWSDLGLVVKTVFSLFVKNGNHKPLPRPRATSNPPDPPEAFLGTHPEELTSLLPAPVSEEVELSSRKD